MSAQHGSSSLSDEIVSYMSSTLIGNYCAASATCIVLPAFSSLISLTAIPVIVVYDHICTIPMELRLIWGKRLNLTILLFHINRWIIFAWAIFTALTTFLPEVSINRCAGMYYTNGAIEMCAFGIWAGFSGIRVYALSGGSHLITIAVVLLSTVPVATNAYGYYVGNNWQIITFPVIGTLCNDAQKISGAMDNILTWSRTWSMIRMARRQNVWNPLMTLLLRDGTSALNNKMKNLISSFLGNMGESVDYNHDGDLNAMWEDADGEQPGAQCAHVDHRGARDLLDHPTTRTNGHSAGEVTQCGESAKVAMAFDSPDA
ncbi:hypothetical protein CERSUDRAFT_75141 [Gelatoporia subvermispora B]|uniref:DUF6533 domain-containing protein n=1 Tax=Ceriporiopsis subvermispora (strain B) TaxID=914234 RepID=M2QU23_CERS8|nr:hypothetical protein CERSUDRAFT_75141 [Gelatoporia subvermispora B]